MKLWSLTLERVGLLENELANKTAEMAALKVIEYRALHLFVTGLRRTNVFQALVSSFFFFFIYMICRFRFFILHGLDYLIRRRDCIADCLCSQPGGHSIAMSIVVHLFSNHECFIWCQTNALTPLVVCFASGCSLVSFHAGGAVTMRANGDFHFSSVQLLCQIITADMKPLYNAKREGVPASRLDIFPFDDLWGPKCSLNAFKISFFFFFRGRRALCAFMNRVRVIYNLSRLAATET